MLNIAQVEKLRKLDPYLHQTLTQVIDGRGDGERVRAAKPGRPPKYKTERERRAAKTEQQRRYRHDSSVEKTVCIPPETKELQAQKRLLSYYRTFRPGSGQERAPTPEST